MGGSYHTRLLAVTLGYFAACGGGSPAPGQPCGPGGECPAGQACDLVDQVCLPEDEACTVRPCEETVLDIPAAIDRDIDILFVINNGGGMAEEQASLAANFQRFVDVLETLEGGLPNLNIGVVSTDVGAGPYGISGCSELGDNGALQATRGEAAPIGCVGPSGAFIQDWDDGVGGRLRNYDTAQGLAATFSCIAELGISGCGFDQPLESMRRALDGSVASNAGFIDRQGALLAILLVTSEDDCSAEDVALFDTSSMTVDDPLGPLGEFRCFEFGVDCEVGNEDRRAVGPRMGCGPRADSPYMFHPDEYGAFLRDLKGDASRVVVGGIFGDPAPVVVGGDPEYNNPELAPTCVTASGEAVPAIRLQHLVDAFAPQSTTNTICNEDLSDALIASAVAIRRAAGHPCIEADIDLDANTAGVQYQCEAAEVHFAGQANEEVTPLAECDAPHDNTPCWYLSVDTATCPGMLLEVDRGGVQPPPDTRVQLRCLVP